MKKIPQVAGLIWYKSKEDFLRARAIFTDEFLLPDTYEEFLVRFAEGITRWEAEGYTVIKAEFDPGTFVAWCNERSLNVDAHGREAFAHEVAINFVNKNFKV